MPRVIELFVDHFLTIDQGTPDNNPLGASVNQTFAMTDLARNYQSGLQISQRLNLGQNITLQRSVYYLTVAQGMPFYQRGGNGPELQQLTQFFHIGQEARLVKYEALADTITFTDSVEVTRSKNASNTVVFTHAATYIAHRSLSPIHTFVIGSSVSCYIYSIDFYSVDLPTLSGPNAPEFP